MSKKRRKEPLSKKKISRTNTKPKEILMKKRRKEPIPHRLLNKKIKQMTKKKPNRVLKLLLLLLMKPPQIMLLKQPMKLPNLKRTKGILASERL